MLPIAICVDTKRIALIGNGESAAKRLSMLYEAGAQNIDIYAPSGEGSFGAHAQSRIIPRLPQAAEIADYHLIYVADCAMDVAEAIAKHAREANVLVNVEDVLPLCDFHVPAIMRRGDLLLSISTGGKAPGLARRVKHYLAKLFPSDWADYVNELAHARAKWRKQGDDISVLAQKMDKMIDEKGWLS